jgi:hypothetical protein
MKRLQRLSLWLKVKCLNGYEFSVVGAALEMAWAKDCHHILMQSGRADPRVHRF